MTEQELLMSNNSLDKFIYARYCYRTGEPFMEDDQYEELAERLKDDERAKEFLGRTYDDDPIPYELLRQLGKQDSLNTLSGERLEIAKVFDEDKTFSIKSVTSYRGAYDFMIGCKRREQDVMCSLKEDGVNTRIIGVDDNFVMGISRARHAVECLDYTKGLKHYIKPKFGLGGHEMLLVGETYVEESALPYLRKKYGKPFKTCKSTALSGLRVEMDHEDYKYFHTNIFYAEGIGTTLEERFSILEKEGFETPPHKLLKWRDVPEDFDEFCRWFKVECMDYIFNEGLGMPSDGVVLEVNDLNFQGEVSGQYVSRQLACKFEYWSYQYYKGIVEDLVIQQNRVFASVRIKINPMKTADGCEAKTLNGYTLAIVIEANAHKGATVYFERNSGSINALLYGDRLEKILKEETNQCH